MSDQEINCHSLFEMGMTVQAKTAGQIVDHPDYNTTTVAIVEFIQEHVRPGWTWRVSQYQSNAAFEFEPWGTTPNTDVLRLVRHALVRELRPGGQSSPTAPRQIAGARRQHLCPQFTGAAPHRCLVPDQTAMDQLRTSRRDRQQADQAPHFGLHVGAAPFAPPRGRQLHPRRTLPRPRRASPGPRGRRGRGVRPSSRTHAPARMCAKKPWRSGPGPPRAGRAAPWSSRRPAGLRPGGAPGGRRSGLRARARASRLAEGRRPPTAHGSRVAPPRPRRSPRPGHGDPSRRGAEPPLGGAPPAAPGGSRPRSGPRNRWFARRPRAHAPAQCARPGRRGPPGNRRRRPGA